MSLKDRIASYLTQGLKAADVAEICGCSAGYISQLLKDTNFKEAVEATMREAPPSEDESLNAKYQGLEHKIVAEMSVAVSGAELPHLTRALEAVSRSQDMREKRKNPLLQAVNQQNIQIVSVMLPSHAIQAPKPLTLNAQSEVVAIGDKPLAPMSSAGVKNLFESLQSSAKLQELQDTQNGPTATIANLAKEATDF